MRLTFLAVLPLLVCYVGSVPTSKDHNHVLHEKRSASPIDWHKTTRASSHDLIPLKIGLKQQNLEYAEKFLHDVSHPDSPSYGQHWTSEQVANAFAPAKETVHGVVRWLQESGFNLDRIRSIPGRHWIELNVTIAEAEDLLKTEYYMFMHKDTGGHRAGCDAYYLPSHVQKHVDFIMPTVQLDGLRPSKRNTQSLESRDDSKASCPLSNDIPCIPGAAGTGLHGLEYCHDVLSIDCLRALYQFGPGNYSFENNTIGIAEWADYLYYPDLELYFQNWTAPKIPDNTRPNFISIDGGKTGNKTQVVRGFTGEGTQDVQLAYSIVYPQTMNYYQVGDGVNIDTTGTFNIFLDALDGSYCTYMGGNQPYLDPTYPDDFEGGWKGDLQCGGAPKSSVISVSYMQIEAALPEFYQRRQCHEWMKLALQGVTVVFASGDEGVANRYNAGYRELCVDPDLGTVNNNGTGFAPSFPVNCPYITSAGATYLKTKNISDGEAAISFSGGGFSNVFARPSWQDTAVTTYLENYGPDYGSKVYNRSGRGFPDVSAAGVQVPIVVDGVARYGGGTSASAPIFASLINLINGERIAIGKKPVGFINPVLYKHPEMFNDITEGNNPGCGTKGFNASPGWDPISGMGTPNYEKMKEVFLNLP